MRRHTLILSVLGLGLVGAAVTPVEICPDTTAENSGTVCACSPATPSTTHLCSTESTAGAG